MVLLTRWFLLLAWISGVAQASVARGASSGSASAASSSSSPPATICLYLADGIYETRHVSPRDAHEYMTLGVALDKACVCESLCSGYSTYSMSENKCTCLSSAKAYKLSRQLQAGVDDFFVEDPTGDLDDCDDDDECDEDSPCASNQICVAKDDDCGCQPIRCASPFGNPCGPNSICTDTPAGYTCTRFLLKGCPAGCGPNAFCNTALAVPVCTCRPGFNNPIAYLGCVPV